MKKTEIPGVYKVSEGILINKDNEALMKYKARKSSYRETENRINTMDTKIESLSQELNEIKVMLKMLIEKK